MYPFYTAEQPGTLTRVLKAEVNQLFSRETGTLAGGVGEDRLVKVGTLLGRRTIGAVAGVAGVGNTGNGGIGTISAGPGAKVGAIAVTCIATAVNGGRFQVVDSAGYRLPDALVGVAYVHNQIRFIISDGATDFVVGDSFSITVAAGDGKYLPLNFAAVDGTQTISRIAGQETTAPIGVDVSILMLRWGCIVAKQALIWPVGATDDQKSAALALLVKQEIFAWDQA